MHPPGPSAAPARAPPGSNAGSPHSIALDSHVILFPNALSTAAATANVLGLTIAAKYSSATAVSSDAALIHMEQSVANVLAARAVHAYVYLTHASGLQGQGQAVFGQIESNVSGSGTIGAMKVFIAATTNSGNGAIAAIWNYEVTDTGGFGAGVITDLVGYHCAVLTKGTNNYPIDLASCLRGDYDTTANELRLLVGDNAGTLQRLKTGASGTGPGGVGKAVYI